MKGMRRRFFSASLEPSRGLLCTAVLAVFLRVVLGWLRRAAARHGLRHGQGVGFVGEGPNLHLARLEWMLLPVGQRETTLGRSKRCA
jgi:hypothetical protein